MTEVLERASSAADYEAFAGLITEYAEWCRARYRHDVGFINDVFGHQSLSTELANLAAIYGPPAGRTLLVRRDGRVCAACAYRRLPDASCEMKRLFVARGFEGSGMGRRLCEALIESARGEGFGLMRLDTLSLLREAIALYQKVGFHPCAPYREYPSKLTPHLVFMELSLGGKESSAAQSSTQPRA